MKIFKKITYTTSVFLAVIMMLGYFLHLVTPDMLVAKAAPVAGHCGGIDQSSGKLPPCCAARSNHTPYDVSALVPSIDAVAVAVNYFELQNLQPIGKVVASNQTSHKRQTEKTIVLRI